MVQPWLSHEGKAESSEVLQFTRLDVSVVKMGSCSRKICVEELVDSVSWYPEEVGFNIGHNSRTYQIE